MFAIFSKTEILMHTVPFMYFKFWSDVCYRTVLQKYINLSSILIRQIMIINN